MTKIRLLAILLVILSLLLAARAVQVGLSWRVEGFVGDYDGSGLEKTYGNFWPWAVGATASLIAGVLLLARPRNRGKVEDTEPRHHPPDA
jgi:hypothetical protein